MAMKPPSFVRYSLTSGLVESLWYWCGSVSASSTLVPEMVIPIAHRPIDIKDTSTTVPLPVFSRWYRAVPMPPARAIPDWRSPNPGPGIARGTGASGGVTPIDAPLRVQYVTPSKPPRSDCSPLGPWALPRA